MTSALEVGPTIPRPRVSNDASISRSLARIEELLVLHEGDAAWWSNLARRIEELTEALREHEWSMDGRTGLHTQMVAEQPGLAFSVKTIEREHAELSEQLNHLREIVFEWSGKPTGVALALAETTAVVASVHGHARRERALLVDISVIDLGEPA